MAALTCSRVPALLCLLLLAVDFVCCQKRKACEDCQKPSDLCCALEYEKCCPADTKPGFCQLTGVTGGASCVDSCRRDKECPGAQKCCGGCGRQCVDPVFQPLF
uniref:U11-Liphistoxin-Lsp1a_1 n=1 Tax=Liphistius sp. SGP-2016 TaxID=1905180 RepID=A0A4Q8K512_9ARAC